MKKLSFRDEIRSIAEDRGVSVLLHFTQAINLKGIVKHGLLPRRDLEGADHCAYASAQYRLDENRDAVSVSISRTNKLMFASKRHVSGHSDWVILVLPSHILWTHKCQFCWRNAAKREIRDHFGFRGGPWAFARMFDGSEADRLGLEPCEPTDPAAEVQVLEQIASEHIMGAVVASSELVGPVQQQLSNLPAPARPVLVDADVF